MKNEITEKLKSISKMKGFVFVVIGILAGIVLLLIPESHDQGEITPVSSVYTSAEYCAHLEQKAESLIKELPQVEDCDVFITLESGYIYIYATDQHIRETSDSKETDKTIVLAGNGNGESPILVEETMPKIAGVAVVCPNASYDTQYRIVELMSALFNIPSNRISVQN